MQISRGSIDRVPQQTSKKKDIVIRFDTRQRTNKDILYYCPFVLFYTSEFNLSLNFLNIYDTTLFLYYFIYKMQLWVL